MSAELEFIRDFLDTKLNDEQSDTGKYMEASEKIMEATELDEGTREAIAAAFKKISADEESHDALLQSIQNIVGTV